MILAGKIKLDTWNGIAWFVSSRFPLKEYIVKNAEFKTEKVFVPAFSEALVRKCYIDGRGISNGRSCKFDTKTNKIVEIEQSRIGSWKR